MSLGGESFMSFVITTTSGLRIGLRSAMFSIAIVGLVLFMGASVAKAQAFSEGFDVVPVAGWFTQNNSVPVGTTNWFQGTPATFPAQTGATNSYIGANFNNTTGTNTISNWLVTPQRTLSAGDVIKFWTRTPSVTFPDRLQVRISLAGASTNVGTGNAAVGDFTTKIADINEFYGTAYPLVWTEFTLTLTSAQVPTPTSGRIAFRYFVEDGGPAGDNSNFIGIDTFSYTPGVPLAPGDAPVDFNGDGRTDWVVARNIGGVNGQLRWFWNINGGGATAASDWGLNNDILVPSDYDNDNRDDIAVWRPGAAGVAAFYILNSATSTARVELFGQTGDNPTVVNNYGGTAADDIAVWRSTDARWYWRTTPGGPVNSVIWGAAGDFVAPGDYNGDGIADFGIQRGVAGAGQFWIRLSTGVIQPVQTFGLSTDVVITADFDGDARTDLATARGVSGAIQWAWQPSSGGAIQYRTFGTSATDTIAPGDYDGDGRADPAVFRNGVFFVLNSTNGAPSFFTLGGAGDRVPANYNTH